MGKSLSNQCLIVDEWETLKEATKIKKTHRRVATHVTPVIGLHLHPQLSQPGCAADAGATSDAVMTASHSGSRSSELEM